MPENYKMISCIIDNRDCDDTNTCEDCHVAIEEVKREQIEENSQYLLTNSIKLGNRGYRGNKKYTVVKVDVDDIEYLKQYLYINKPEEISPEKYLLNVASYPEWEKTKEVLKITENPDKILFEKDKPLIVFFGKEIYIIAPDSKNDRR